MGLLDYFFGEPKATGEERLVLIAARALEIHAKKRGRKTQKVWHESQRTAVEELRKEGKI